mgnify:FL=1
MVTIAKIDSHNITPASYTPQNRQQILQDTQVQEKKELEQKEKEINEKIDKEQIKQEKDTNLYSPAKEKDSYQKPVKSSEVSTKDISNFKTSSRQAKIEDRTDNRDKNTAAEKLKEKVANRSRIKTLKNVSKRITGTSKKETGNRTKKSKTQTGHSKQKKHTEKEQKTYKGNSHIIDNKNKYDYKDLMPLEEKKIPQHTSKGKSDKTGQITGESTKTLSNPLNIAMAEKIKLREAMEKIKGKQEEEKQQGEQRILKKNPGENSKSNKLLPLNEIRKNYEKKYKEIKKTGGEAETGGNGKNIQEIKRRDNSSRTTEAISQTKAKENNIHDEKSVKNLPEERKNLIKDKDIVREKSGSPNELTEKKDIRDGRDNADKDIKRLKELENKEGMTEKQKIEIRGKRKEAEDIKNEREELSKEIAAKESRKKSENEIKKPLEFEENSNSGMKPKERIDKNKIPKLISLEKLRENYNMKYNGFKTQELKEARHAEYVIKDNKDISSKNSERENQRIYKPSITNEPAVDQLRQGEKIKERDTEKDKKIAVKLQDKTQPVRERKMDFDGKSDVSHDRDKIFPGEAQMTGWKIGRASCRERV